MIAAATPVGSPLTPTRSPPVTVVHVYVTDACAVGPDAETATDCVGGLGVQACVPVVTGRAVTVYGPTSSWLYVTVAVGMA